MLWAAASLCFFGFFQSGELTVPSHSAYEQRLHLSWGDVSIDDTDNPSTLQVFLKRSKTDQFGLDVHVFVGKSHNNICPVSAITAFVALRGNQPSAFFRAENGQPLSKPEFIQGIRSALELLDMPQQLFAGHSFRIGAATAAAQVAIEDSTIQALGRWSSSAFLRYIRTPREQLARFTTQLASVTPTNSHPQ